MEKNKKKIKKKKWLEHSLYWYANEYRKRLTDEDQLEQIDMTDLFLWELEQMIKGGEIIIININAKMRLGKSTLGFAIGQIIYDLLKKYKYKPKDSLFGLNNVARDHQEHSKIMRNPETQYTVIVTDESNELENTGENVTVEQALNKVFSDVQAARYVHRVCCSPKEIIDANADILLSVTSIDKKTRTTHAKLYYRFYEGGQEHVQLLGHVNIPVGRVINTWESKVKKHYYKPNKTEEDEKIIEKHMKTDWYTHYIIKKHEKMDLITKEGIFKPRVLDYSEIILTVVNKLKKLTRMQSILTPNIVKNFVKMEFTKMKIPTSIVGEELTTKEVLGMLETYRSYWKIVNDIKTTENRFKAGKLTEDEYEIEKENLEDIKQTLITTIQIQDSEMKRYQEIKKRYDMDVTHSKVQDMRDRTPSK